jgi:hypothetical protein
MHFLLNFSALDVEVFVNLALSLNDLMVERFRKRLYYNVNFNYRTRGDSKKYILPSVQNGATLAYPPR